MTERRETLLDQIEAFLIENLQALKVSSAPSGPGRPLVLPALCLWAGLLVCVLRGFQSQQALWRLLTVKGLWLFGRFSVSDQAVYDRLERGGIGPLQRLFEQISVVLRARLAPFAISHLASFASEVCVLDATTLDQVARVLPAQRETAGDVPLLPGKLATLFDLRRQQWQQALFIDDPHENDKVKARTLVQSLPRGALVLADLGYFGFDWFDWLTEQQYWWVSRLRAKTSYDVLHCFYAQGETFDGLVFLGKYRADRAAHAVRLVQFRLGERLCQYLTNVLDPQKLSMGDMAQLYARRWDIEMAFNLVKTHLGLHLLWSAKTVVIQQQVWAVLIIAQILQTFRLEIAGRAEVDPYDVSMALLVQYAPQFARMGYDPVQAFVEQGRAAGFIRPSRRIRIQAPVIPASALLPVPENLRLERKPRHAQRKCAPRQPKSNLLE
jgi:hypothetical protein